MQVIVMDMANRNFLPVASLQAVAGATLTPTANWQTVSFSGGTLEPGREYIARMYTLSTETLDVGQWPVAAPADGGASTPPTPAHKLTASGMFDFRFTAGVALKVKTS